jgi:signal transduction histidine kinase
MAHRGGLASSPRVTRGADGKLYFDTLDSVAVVDPANIVEPSFTPSLIVEDVLVNRRSVKTGGNQLFLKPDDIQFEYTSLNLRAPENVRFRYRLDGYDKDWVSAGTQRRASYGLLKPGSYRFRVVGSSGERGWSKQEASYAFRIGAPFYEQTPYRLAALCLLAAIFWLIHRYKLQREAAHVRLQAEAQGDERLRIAQDMHDTFLQGIQASRIMVEVGLNYMDKRPSESKRLLQRAVAIMSDATQQARQTVSSLRSTVPSSILLSRIEKLAAEAETHPVKALVKVESTGTPRKLCPTVDDDIYLTVSEAFCNALKHARAKQIQIAIHFRPAELEITVTDDGIGISPSTLLRGREGHFGLTGMRERAERVGGALRIDSDEGKGTQIRLLIPARRIYGERVFSASMRSPILSK